MEASGTCARGVTGEISTEWLAAQVEAAGARVDPHVTRTELVRIPWLDGPERETWAKLECRQRTGSFKARGAFNALLALERPRRGVVTASAGNHGLALATAAAALEVPCTTFVPVGVSELKLRRLSATGARIEPAGRDLFEAMRAARSEAAREGGPVYVSAYADWGVIAGQGTIALDVLEQTPAGFDELLVPLGGGGLLAGVGSVIEQTSPRTHVVAVHPQAFDRGLEQGAMADRLRRPVLPTVADGLAVQVGEDEDHALPLVDTIADRCVEVGEQAIQTAIYALLHNDGILVEGAGAVGVASLLDDLAGEQHRGRVLLLLTGGNIATAQLSRAMAVGVYDDRLRRLLGFRGNRLALEVEEAEGVQRAPAQHPTRRAGERSDEVLDEAPLRLWREVLDRARSRLELIPEDVERHRRYLAQEGLFVEEAIYETVEEQLRVARGLLERCEIAREGPPSRLRAPVRLLLQTVASLRTELAWCSASADQSVEVSFFEPSDQRGSGVNYSRYGFAELRDLELHLLDLLDFDSQRVGVCAASSGMAAYQLIEAFLLRDVLRPGDCVLYAPYVYFESHEHAAALPHVDHVEASSFAVDDLVADVEEKDARVLFLDPLANVPPLPTIDLRALAAKTAGRGWGERWLVIDGTMVSGAIDPFDWFGGEGQPNVLYYESASKYLQLGTDFQMAGVVAAKRAVVPRLHRHRRNSGSVLYEVAVERFPRCSRAAYLDRMRLLTRNAELLVGALERAFAPDPPFELGFPRDWERLGWLHGGGVVSLRFAERGLNNRDELERLIELFLRGCREQRLRLTKGVSFGFATTRVSASAAMAESTDPFLRFAVGEEGLVEMTRLADVLAASLRAFLAD